MKSPAAGARRWPTRRRTPIVMIGDGTYLMMNSDIYSSVLTGHKMIMIVCDNGGYAVIDRLQNAKGDARFNNLIGDCRVKEPFAVDFAKHAEAMGALTRHVESLADLGARSMGEDDRPDDRHFHRLGRFRLDAWRCVVGCRRPRGQRQRKACARPRSSAGRPQEASASASDLHGSVHR